MGCYQEGIAKNSIAGKDVTAHIFEYTSSVVVTDTGEVSMGACPVQILFCLKEQNKKKLNSHRWFFNAFGPLIKPNGMPYQVNGVPVVAQRVSQSAYFSMSAPSPPAPQFTNSGNVITPPLKPTRLFLFLLNAGFDRHSSVGGACGESVSSRRIRQFIILINPQDMC